LQCTVKDGLESLEAIHMIKGTEEECAFCGRADDMVDLVDCDDCGIAHAACHTCAIEFQNGIPRESQAV
jgi:hypothetical protein